jgi:hypothetical protein
MTPSWERSTPEGGVKLFLENLEKNEIAEDESPRSFEGSETNPDSWRKCACGPLEFKPSYFWVDPKLEVSRGNNRICGLAQRRRHIGANFGVNRL